jgi:DNA-binding transcriptional MerR regulator
MKTFSEMVQEARSRYAELDARGKMLLWAGAVIGVLMISGFLSARPPELSSVKVKEPVVPATVKKEENGYFLGEDVDRKAYIERLEAQYFSVAEKNQALSSRLDDVAQRLTEMSNAQSKVTETLADLDRRVRAAAVTAVSIDGDKQPDVLRNYQLQVININPVKAHDARTVYLPAGSFVHATLLTGVYAPAESGNPLPVLIRLKEAFYGPNDTRIPLEGAFAIGKAAGDLNSERALVQITSLSAVLPTGEAFEHKGNIGYLTDIFGQLGLKGVVVRNTGGQMAMSFMTGVMGGASQAMADSQTTVVSGDNGQVARNVTGSRAKNAAFQGMAQSAAQMSKYYEDQLEKIVPAVKVDAGVDVYFIVLEGVEVHGLKKDDPRSVGFID